MQNSGQGVACAPPIHAQPSSTVADAVALHFTEERSVWSSEMPKPYNPRPHGSSSLFRVKGRRGHPRFHLHPRSCAALAAVVTAYLLLRCSLQFWASTKRSEPKSIPRSLSVVKEEGKDPEGPCVPWGVGESTLPAVGGEHLDGKQVLERAKLYTVGVGEALQESRSVLLQVPGHYCVKAFSNMLRLGVLELAAQCSLLEPSQRHHVESAADVAGLAVALFTSDIISRGLGRASLRHFKRVRQMLRQLPKMDFEGTRMSPADRLTKLAQLISLQEVALAQLNLGMQSLVSCCQQEGESIQEDVATMYVDAMHQTATKRRDHVLADSLLGRWLRTQHPESSHYGLVSPRIIKELVGSPGKPHDELLKELLCTRLGLLQQQSSRGARVHVDVRADAQGLGAPLPAVVHAGPVETTPNPPKGWESSEAPAEPGQLAEGGRCGKQLLESSGASAIPASSGSLGLAGSANAPAATGTGVGSSSSTLPPVPGPHVPSGVSIVPDSPLVPSSHQPSTAIKPPQSPPIVGMPVPWSSVGRCRHLPFSGPSMTSQSADVAAGFGNSESPRNDEHSWQSESTPPQASSHRKTHHTAPAPAATERPESSTANWALKGVQKAPTWPAAHAQPPNVPHAGLGDASEADNEPIDDIRPADPANQGRPGNHAPGPPVLQPMFPSGPSGSFPQMQSSAQQYSSGESPFDVSRASDIWGFNGPSTGQAAIQSLSEGSGMRADLSAGSSSWSLPGAQSGLPSRWHRGSDRPWSAFRGVAVGEPVERLSKEDSAPAAHVAANLFSWTYVDLNKSLALSRAQGRQTDGE
ncbi:hypothetical protein, conserved [Eimeria acervulina]|uniref:Uncharacterized protein n=1 Tax=Eimeria acervulina TaxID=5801 RepID=U6GPQ6_EIMAC|nr:hypothetical protein, conserved [Eimeria acervulina]CDI82206.1 hypothetical protein, conserved [Eimeria acervulina]